jgi:hypothetical protein
MAMAHEFFEMMLLPLTRPLGGHPLPLWGRGDKSIALASYPALGEGVSGA